MKKLLSLTLMLLSAATIAMAQNTVSGTVTDLNSNPLASWKVSVVDNNRQMNPITVMTNSNGQYSATLPSSLPTNTALVAYTSDCNSNLVSNNHTYTGSNITSNFSICAGNPSGGGINGVIWINNSSKRSIRAVVYLIEKCSGNPTTLALIDSTLTDTLGAYSFANYPTLTSGCDLLMKAALLPADPHYSNYMPSYYVTQSTSALLWSGATKVTSAGNVNIKLLAGTNPGGPGFIGGSVLQGANKGTGVGDPLPNRIIVLTDVYDYAVAFAYSDANGQFSFSNLPHGTYKLHGDAWGKDNPALTVDLDANKESITSIIFRESSKKMEGTYDPTSVSGINSIDRVNVYPNPVQNMLNITGAHGAAYTVSDITGRVMFSGNIASNNLSIDVSGINAGIYILNIAKEGNTANVKFTKQ